MVEVRKKSLERRSEQPKISEFKITLGGKEAATLRLQQFKYPTPFVYLRGMFVDIPFRNKGIGVLVINKFNEFLLKNDKVGVLKDSTTDFLQLDDRVESFYRRYGWSDILDNSHGQILVFNSNDLSDENRRIIHKLISDLK